MRLVLQLLTLSTLFAGLLWWIRSGGPFSR